MHDSFDTPDHRAPQAPDTIRDHLANLRTLLAWGRTGIAIIGIGFVIARFGLALRELSSRQHPIHSTGLSTPFGVSMIICGIAVLLGALQQYFAVGKAIDRQEFHWSPLTGFILIGLLVVIGSLLAIYLILTNMNV